MTNGHLFLKLVCCGALVSSCDAGVKPTPLQERSGGSSRDPNKNECGTPIDSTYPLNDAAPPPISGGTMAATGHGTVVIGDADRARVWVVSNYGKEVRSFTLLPSDLPGRTIAGPDDTAFVVLRGANQIARVGTVPPRLERFDTCRAPRAVSFDASSGALTVGCADGTLERFQDGVRQVLEVSRKVQDLRDLAQDGDRLIATSFRSAGVFSISASGETRELHHENVSDAGVARVAWRMVPGPFGPMISYQTHLTDTLPVTSGNLCTVPVYYRTPGANLVTASVGVVGRDRVIQTHRFADLVLPVDLAVDAVGDYAIVTPNESVALSWSRPASGTEPEAGFGFLYGETVAVAERDGDWFAFGRDPAKVSYFTKKTFGSAPSVVLDAKSVRSTGHTLFHQSTASNLACASCHPEGGDDGHTWNFSSGARLTPTLRGGLSMTAPFHWSGDRPTMGDLMADVLVTRMGGNAQSQARVSALTTWLDGLAADAPPPVDLASAKRGQALFESAQTGCVTCHTGPLGTNNQSFEVGTGGVFNVPRLVELGWRPNWLHDGRVKGFTALGGDGRHGHTEQLNASEKHDLLEYLKSR